MSATTPVDGLKYLVYSGRLEAMMFCSRYLYFRQVAVSQNIEIPIMPANHIEFEHVIETAQK